jgi:F-type H+-transporting ATPase subunit b
MEILNFRELGTQILGFLLVVWLLGKYAWPPVLGFIEARRQGIAADLQRAADERADAAKLHVELEKELRAIETRARARIQEAVAEGQQIASDLKASTQREATARLQRLSAELALEHEKAMVTLREDVVRLAIGSAEKVVREKLDEKSSRRLVEEFIVRVATDEGGKGR